MLEFDVLRLRNNVATSSTEDLLDRATVYSSALEAEALPVILEELRARGVTADDIVRHEQGQGPWIEDEAGAARPCSRCRRPAVAVAWKWHRIFGLVPVFVRRFYLCRKHAGWAEPEATGGCL